MLTKVLFGLFLISCINKANSAKILAVFPFGKGSQYILGNGVARALVEAGHDVTLVASVPDKNPPKGGKWSEVILTGFFEEMTGKQFPIFKIAYYKCGFLYRNLRVFHHLLRHGQHTFHHVHTNVE